MSSSSCSHLHSHRLLDSQLGVARLGICDVSIKSPSPRLSHNSYPPIESSPQDRGTPAAMSQFVVGSTRESLRPKRQRISAYQLCVLTDEPVFLDAVYGPQRPYTAEPAPPFAVPALTVPAMPPTQGPAQAQSTSEGLDQAATTPQHSQGQILPVLPLTPRPLVPFEFEKLAAELKNCIYQYVIQNFGGVYEVRDTRYMAMTAFPCNSMQPILSRLPGLAYTSKAIYVEFLKMLLDQTEVIIASKNDMEYFHSAMIVPEAQLWLNVHRIRFVKFTDLLDIWPRKPAVMEFLKFFPNLKVMTLVTNMKNIHMIRPYRNQAQLPLHQHLIHRNTADEIIFDLRLVNILDLPALRRFVMVCEWASYGANRITPTRMGAFYDVQDAMVSQFERLLPNKVVHKTPILVERDRGAFGIDIVQDS